MGTACVVWILWSAGSPMVKGQPPTSWIPVAGVEKWVECMEVREKWEKFPKGDKGETSYHCFPHTFDPRPTANATPSR